MNERGVQAVAPRDADWRRAAAIEATPRAAAKAAKVSPPAEAPRPERPATPARRERRHVSTLLMAVSVVGHGLLFSAYVFSDEAEAQPRPRQQEVEISLEPPPPPPPEQPPAPLPQAARPQVARPRAPARAREVPLPKADPDAPPDPDQVLVPEEPEPSGPVANEPGPPGPAVPAIAPGPAPVKLIEAHEGANYLKNPRPAYPPLALDRGWEGTVLLRVRVTPHGSPENVVVARSSGRDMLDEAAIETVKTWAFVPARSGATPVAGWVTVPIVFKIQ